MEEAKFSFNVKCLVEGFECCFTLREDQAGKGTELVDRALQTISYLVAKGAVPVRAFPGKPSAASAPTSQSSVLSQADALFDKPTGSHPAPAGQAVAIRQPAAKQVGPPVCPICGQSDQVELISFEKDGKFKQAFKCQRCKKWQH